YLGGLRKRERYKEPWGALLSTFFGGAVFAVIISLILSLIIIALYNRFARVYDIFDLGYTMEALLLACVIAPLVEEAAKGWVARRKRKSMLREEDGFVYGAASGFGFAATENVMYGLLGYSVAGVEGYLVIVVIRSISAAFLHGSATAFMGYGIARSQLYGESAIPFFLLAVFLHSFYNLLASLGVVLGPEYGLVSLAMAITMGAGAFWYVKKKMVMVNTGYR
ncbi:MAG: PrsW family glutamic-type intramembrane protease, partial [Candidatus Thermoplasmatota archaeon]|nr:PrsW family glutamic-type intramembrane protease [Candidatus Thermoplasmatota archaeon]